MPRKKAHGSERGARQPQDYVAVGRVVRPHGVRGALLIEAAPDLMQMIRPSSQVFLGQSREPVVVAAVRPHGNLHLLFLQGVEDREAAERHRGAELRLSEAEMPDLPPGTYYHWEIIGLDVVSEEGESLGRVQEILQTGANDVYVVRGPAGEEILLPAIEPVVLEVDLIAQRMRVHLLPGLREGDVV
jgi:16S rRNA processing protein RimM